MNSSSVVDSVFARSREVLPALAGKTVAERLVVVERLKNQINRQSEKIIDQIVIETKKSRSDALMSEVFGVLDFLNFLLKRSERILRERAVSTPLALMGKKSFVQFQPMGVVLVISPWNYPFYQAIVPTVLSFVCGNATIYKPSEHTPLQGLLEDLFRGSGFPSDAIQIVYGGPEIGQTMIEARPDKIFFTGSDRTGRAIMKQAAAQLIPVELELGGNDPMIVFEDVTIPRAVAGALWGGLTNCGQACTSVERVYVQESIFPAFREELDRQMGDLKLGRDEDSDIGGLTVPFQAQKIQEHLQDARSGGAQISSDGASDQPVWVEGAAENSKLLTEETFGPVIPLVSFGDESEAIQKANASDYGLSASVWSKDLRRAKRVARQLAVGNVSINNVMLTEGNSELPFGGLKKSGFGRYKGEFGFYSFSNVQSILVDSDSAKIEANWYPYTRQKYRLFSEMTRALFGGGVVNLVRFAIAGLKLERLSQKKRPLS